MNSLSRYNLAHKFIPMPQAMKLPAAKVAVEKEMGENSLMDVCHLENLELEPHFQKYIGRVVLRGHNVKDDSGSHAVFTEQGSSACKSNGCDIKTNRMRRTSSRSSIRSYSGQTWKMHHHCLKFQSHNVQIFGYVYQNTNGQNHGPAWKIQSFFLREIWTVILWQDHYGKGKFEKVLSAHSWEQVSNWECLFFHREKRVFLSVSVDEIKQAGKKQNSDPMWKVR